MRRLTAAFLVALAASSIPAGVWASDLVLIYDASGSMWGQVEGENKIVSARRVFGKLVDGLPPDTRVALVAYGHRQKSDCGDIETVVPLGPLDRAGMKKSVDGLDPKGKTPITRSFLQAIELVKKSASEDGATVILVSDGLETCDGDPCKAVREAKAAGVKFVFHIIGFDVAKEDVSSLECAAQAGDGLFLGAENADELGAALDSAVALPAEAAPSRLSVRAVANGELQDAAVHVTVAKTRAEAGGGRTYADPSTNPRIIPLPPGVYDVVVKAVGVRGDIAREFRGIEIAAGETVGREVDFSSGEIGVKVTHNGELSDATVNVRAAGERTEVAGGRTYESAETNPRLFTLTGGKYDVEIGAIKIGGNPKHVFPGVEVKPGERVELAHEFKTGTLSIGVQRGGKLVDAAVNVIHAATGKAVGGGRTYTSSSTNPKKLVLAPSEYRVKVGEVRGDGKREMTVAVEQGKTVEKIVDLDQAP